MNKKKNAKNLTLWVIICSFIFLIIQAFQNVSTQKTENMTFSSFLKNIDEGKVQQVTMRGFEVYGRSKDSKDFYVHNPNYTPLVDRLMEHGVEIKTAPPEDNPSYP